MLTVQYTNEYGLQGLMHAMAKVLRLGRTRSGVQLEHAVQQWPGTHINTVRLGFNSTWAQACVSTSSFMACKRWSPLSFCRVSNSRVANRHVECTLKFKARDT